MTANVATLLNRAYFRAAGRKVGSTATEAEVIGALSSVTDADLVPTPTRAGVNPRKAAAIRYLTLVIQGKAATEGRKISAKDARAQAVDVYAQKSEYLDGVVEEKLNEAGVA